MEKKERLHYIDLSKGLLIIGVVLIHILLPFRGIENPTVSIVDAIGFNTWVLFYMPAFFLISGKCSNFDKSFKQFLLTNLMSLKAPVFFFIGLMGALTIRTEYGFSPFSVKWWFIRMFESGVWFLHAIFLSRLMYWIINHYIKKCTYQIFICLILYIIGFIGIYLDFYPYFWIAHSLVLTIFILIGKLCKEKFINSGWICLFVFCISVVVLHSCGYRLPYIVQNLVCENFIDILIIPLLSISGSVGFIWVCKLIGKSSIIEYIGRNSLMIYVLHDIFIARFNNLSIFIGQQNSLSCFFNLMIVLVGVIACCLVTTYIFDRPYIRIIIGKKP